MKKHPEILMFQLGKENYLFRETSELTATGLNEIFTLPSLSTLIIGRSLFFTEINVNIVSKQLQTLQLTCDIRSLNNNWFLLILEQCGSTLKTLTLEDVNLTDDKLMKYKGTLHCLENLNMRSCYNLTDKGLLQILQLCGRTIISLDISDTAITGENLSEFKGSLPCLDNLGMRSCHKVTNKGLLQLLQLCGSTLRSLDISGISITGENLSEYKGTLSCLENLNMNYYRYLEEKGLLQILQLCGSKLRYLDLSCCKQLTDKGLLQILQLCGSTLRSLDIGYTHITGENLFEYKGTLPCLANLDMKYCEQLTDKGLSQILQLCGSTLRSLDISDTAITDENLSEYKRTLPCLILMIS